MTVIDLNLKDASAIEATLSLGLKKAKLPKIALAAESPLAAIALAAERSIYADTSVRNDLALVEVHPPQNNRRLLPDALRPTLLRIAARPSANNPVWEGYCRAIDREISENGYRLHPFDLWRLEKYLAAINPKPGSYEYWYRQQLSPQTNQALDEEISWENWQQFGKVEQQAFLLQQRSIDPKAARLALEKDFADAPATLRQMYIESLTVGLSQSDQAFLESLESDRSGKVQELAQRLLTRFPGSAAAQQSREALAERVEVHLLSRKIGLAKQKGKKASEALQELATLTQYLSIEDIAATLKLTPDELPRKIAQELAFPFARAAALSQHYSLAEALLEKEEKNVLLAQLSAIFNWFEHAPLPDKLSLAEAATSWLVGADALGKLQLLALYQLIQQPLPEPAAKAISNSKCFKNACLQSVGENPYLAGNAQDALAACALLMPDSLNAAYGSKIANIPFRGGVQPLDYFAFFDALKSQLNEK